jgi:phenolic acid decarboxylase
MMPLNDLQQFCADNNDVIVELAELLSDYLPVSGGVTQAHIMRWLGQFTHDHMSLALKLAKSILYIGNHSIDNQLQTLGNRIRRHIQRERINLDNVFYVPVGSVGESGLDIAHRYRNVNRMRPRNNQFVHLIELPKRLFEHEEKMVVFLDDFIGTGRQVCEYWHQVASQIVPEYIPICLGVVAAYHDGIRRVENECPFTVVVVHELGYRHRLLDAGNQTFTDAEREVFQRYCEEWGNNPLGFGEVGALVSFFHGTPNNAPSLIRGSKKQRPRRGLLPGWADLS